MELKRHMCNVNSKESMNTRVMEYVIFSISHLNHLNSLPNITYTFINNYNTHIPVYIYINNLIILQLVHPLIKH